MQDGKECCPVNKVHPCCHSKDCANLPTPQQPQWEEELANEFNWEAVFGKNNKALESIKSFIRTHFIPKSQIAEVLEGMKIDENANLGGMDYNAALTAAKKALLG